MTTLAYVRSTLAHVAEILGLEGGAHSESIKAIQAAIAAVAAAEGQIVVENAEE